MFGKKNSKDGFLVAFLSLIILLKNKYNKALKFQIYFAFVKSLSFKYHIIYGFYLLDVNSKFHTFANFVIVK